MMPDAVFANVGKLLLATQIYDMHRLAHYVSGGLVVVAARTGRGPQSRDRVPRSLPCMAGRPDIPAEQRARGRAA